MKNAYWFGLWLAVSLSTSTGAAEDASTQLVVTATGDRYKLSVPVSKLELSVPKGDLVPAPPGSGAAASPRYFNFEDSKQHLIVSGWFESADAWKGFDKFAVGEIPALKKSGLTKMPDFFAAPPWQAFAYDVDVPGGHSAHLRAEAVANGTWIDLHVSITGTATPSELQDQLRHFLKSVEVGKKP